MPGFFVSRLQGKEEYCIGAGGRRRVEMAAELPVVEIASSKQIVLMVALAINV